MSDCISLSAGGSAQVKLELTGIGKSYVRDKRPHLVLDGISLHVREGEFVTLIGPSGSGKSTLFRLIGGVERPDAGTIRIGGRDTTGERGHISYMPQQASLFPWLSVAANVASALTTAGLGAQEAAALAAQWLERIGLADVAGEYPHVLSGGMQQRVSFLRALLMPRDVMCLDEPFAALDALTRADMQAWLLRLWEEQRRSVLFVTHSIEEALTLSDRIYVLSRAPARVLREIKVPFERPRRADVWKEPAFVRLKEEVLELLRSTAAR
ncbi:ABC transporter ATP-binding protein [Cohnella lubricantis]|uniref:ABC transporter ATP-binding protein n=1 Tax=Cohnella lubricantis TaxID=2163172 RepID=A0A841TAY1_9BACL|nr:ABC transporter ATP-binding protein [Cohnella lubricantis]MBB6677185.1 ABC transporter ATP-binding protein [Cohnella lubricantis]MBP2117004.1 ABC-type nitrate/sulfonate/bicarbonate transport system ATPase subunit [Cohnella lubricantis]